MEELATLPTPDHITLLLKRHKSTVVLSVLPNASFASIKQSLLAVLKSRNLTTLPGSDAPLPETAEDIEFGILKDKKDPSRGWVCLENRVSDLTESKGGKRKSSGKPGSHLDTPAEVGLSEGSLVAYRLKSEQSKKVDEDEMTDILDDSGWDVILPIYEDEIDEET